MELITVYLKRTTNNNVRYVMVYNDKEGAKLKAIFNSSTTELPNKRRKVITLNCFNYKCEWIN